MAQTVFFAGLFLLPFVHWPKSPIPFETPRVLFFQRWVEILGLVGVIRLINGGGKEVKEKTSRLVYLILIFVLVAVVSSLLGTDLAKSFWGNYYRGDGLLTLIHLIGLFCFLLLFWEKSWEGPLVATLAGGSIFLSLLVLVIGLKVWLFGIFGWGVWSLKKEIGATFGQPNFLAGYLLVTLPFVWGWFKEKRRAVGIVGAGTAGVISAILLTQSRAGLLGVFLFFLFLLLSKGKKKLFLLVLIAAVGIIGVIWGIRKTGEGRGEVMVAESRSRIFTKGVLALGQRPAIGWGWANFDYAFEAINWPIKFEKDVYVDKAHSHLLEVLVTTGFLGLLSYLGIIAAALKLLYKNRSRVFYRTVGLSFLLFLFHSQTNVVSISEEMIFWLILGILAAS